MCKDHLTPCNAGKIPLGLEVHGRMAPSRYPRTATCGMLEGLRMCIQHHPTIQQLASQNHRKLKFQTATFPVVAKWAFLPWEEMRLNHTELMLDVSDSLSYSYVFISFARNSSDINHHKSTNVIKYTYIYIYILTIIHTFRFTKEVWLQISCSWPPTLWLTLLRVPWKDQSPDVKSVKFLAFNVL